MSDLLIGCARLHRTARTTLTARRELLPSGSGTSASTSIMGSPGANRAKPGSRRGARRLPRRRHACREAGPTRFADRRARHRRRPSPPPGRGFDPKPARSDAKRYSELCRWGVGSHMRTPSGLHWRLTDPDATSCLRSGGAADAVTAPAPDVNAFPTMRLTGVLDRLFGLSAICAPNSAISASNSAISPGQRKATIRPFCRDFATYFGVGSRKTQLRTKAPTSRNPSIDQTSSFAGISLDLLRSSRPF